MGRSLNSTHILNSEDVTKAQFKKLFTDMMKSKGYTKATEDDATVSYSLVFTKDRKWVTVTGEDINSAELAKSLGLQVLSVELVDSDFAEVVLHGSDGSADTLMLGEPYFDEYPEPNPDVWQNVLGENNWSKVVEIQSGDYTFAEDALSDFGKLIGLGEDILADEEDMPESAETLYFKKAKEKKLTLNAAFKQVFGPYLEAQGFKLIKGKKFPIYVKRVSDELIYIVSVRKVQSMNFAKSAFEIFGNCVTTYWKEVQEMINESPDYYFQTNFSIYLKRSYRHIELCKDNENKFVNQIERFHYMKNDDDSLIENMGFALDVSKQWLLAEIEKVVDMDSYIKYYTIYDYSEINLFSVLDESTGEIDERFINSLIIIRLGYMDDWMWNVEELCKAYENDRKPLINQKRSNPDLYVPFTQKDYDEGYKKVYDEKNYYRLKQIAIRDRILADKELCARICEMLDKMKTDNNKWLKEIGI